VTKRKESALEHHEGRRQLQSPSTFIVICCRHRIRIFTIEEVSMPAGHYFIIITASYSSIPVLAMSKRFLKKNCYCIPPKFSTFFSNLVSDMQ